MRQTGSHLALTATLGLAWAAWRPATAAEPVPAGQTPREAMAELASPALVLRLAGGETGLVGHSLENRLTGRRVGLGPGPELAVDVGDTPAAARTLVPRVTKLPTATGPERDEISVELVSEPPGLAATVRYRLEREQPILRKTARLVNTGDRRVRLLHVRLGEYTADTSPTGGGQGFPAYVDGEAFLALAHPAGWARVDGQKIVLCQYPGVWLEPGQGFDSMEAVIGVSPAGEARAAFLAHLRGRLRRVVRGHDRPYAIFEPFGARPNGDFNETEEFVLDSIAKVAAGQAQAGCHFDLYSVDFWVDYRGDLKGCDPGRFPNGLSRIIAELRKLGTAPGLWIDSSWEAWSIGGNPITPPTFNFDAREGPGPVSWGRKSFCRATEPIKSMYTEAFRYHIRENGVRLLKFDNLATVCRNPEHEHLPGIYSTEAIANAVIEFLQALDRECPDVFLMLYWGYNSPWWLLHGDTLFDSGLGIEAASPSDFPAPFARDSITQKLDQAQWHATDVPALGKDSLGVWLSSWGWNSSVGKERWQEGFVMDLSRGSLLAQPWSDTAWLSPPEREQMAELISLLKARPECFANPRFILGSPWRNEPYGYCCTDGKRAMLALNNCTWEDRLLELSLGPAWGLPAAAEWDLYRWYPNPARLQGQADRFGPDVTIAARPFEVMLLEAVPHGTAPALARALGAQPLPARFAEASRRLDLQLGTRDSPPAPGPLVDWLVLRPEACRSEGGATLTIQADGSVLASGANPSPDTYVIATTVNLTGIQAIRLDALPDPSLPGSGPGRAVNGNFMLSELRVTAQTADGAGPATPVELRSVVADYSQTSHGGWPVAAALDGNPATAWSIDPAEGQPHVAIFQVANALGTAAGTRLTFTILQGERGHNLGRLRLLATTAPPPVPIPPEFLPKAVVVRGEAPGSGTGGLLVVTAQACRQGKPVETANIGSFFTVEGTLAGRPAPWHPVFGNATYPSSWQGWRLELPPGSAPAAWALAIETSLPPGLEWTYAAHFLPR